MEAPDESDTECACEWVDEEQTQLVLTRTSSLSWPRGEAMPSMDLSTPTCSHSQHIIIATYSQKCCLCGQCMVAVIMQCAK